MQIDIQVGMQDGHSPPPCGQRLFIKPLGCQPKLDTSPCNNAAKKYLFYISEKRLLLLIRHKH